MRETQLESLLTPSLNQAVIHGPMYSISAHVIVAFFGGPFALALFFLWSLKKAGLWARHKVMALGLVIVSLLSVVGVIWLLVNGLPGELKLASTDGQSARHLLRIIALMLIGGIYLKYKSYFLTSAIRHQAPLSPWKPAIAVILIGIFISGSFGGILGGLVNG